MRQCLLLSPIHPCGIERLRRAGIAVLDGADEPRSLVAASHAVVTRASGINAATLDAALCLRVVSHHGVGVDTINVAHATTLGIPVTNTPDATTASVAEQAVLLMLAVKRSAVSADAAARAGDFSFKHVACLAELAGKTLGIVGYGRVGRCVARICRDGLGMRVVALGRTPAPEGVDPSIVWCRYLATLLGESDVVSLHLPMTAETEGIIGENELRLMKSSAIIVNTARGGLIDEAALYAALVANRLAGAGLDVLQAEDATAAHNPLCALPQVVLSPHVGGATEECLIRAAVQAADHVIDVLAGRRPENLVNPEVWDRRRLCDSVK